jgi:hypothetical protein
MGAKGAGLDSNIGNEERNPGGYLSPTGSLLVVTSLVLIARDLRDKLGVNFSGASFHEGIGFPKLHKLAQSHVVIDSI